MPVPAPIPEPATLARSEAQPADDPRRAALRRELLRRIVEAESRRQGVRIAPQR